MSLLDSLNNEVIPIILPRKRETVCGVLIYCDIKADESYTPSEFEIMCGNEPNDLRVIKQVTVDEPKGWIEIPIKGSHHPNIKTWMIQVTFFL